MSIVSCCGREPTEYTMAHPREAEVVGVYYKCNWCDTPAKIAWAASMDKARAQAMDNWHDKQMSKLDV